MKNRIFFEEVFKNNPHWTKEQAWSFLEEQTAFVEFPGQRKCAEAVFREKWGRLPTEKRPEDILADNKAIIEKLMAQNEELEAQAKVVEPEVTVEVPVPATPAVEKPIAVSNKVVPDEPRKRGRPKAMTLEDLNIK